MKLFAQHGFGPGDKIFNGIEEGTIKTTLMTTGVSPWVKASQPKAGKRVLI